MIDGDGLVTTNISWAVIFNYTVTISVFRPTTVKSRTLTPSYSVAGGSFTATSIRDHSPLMSGTFTITLDQTPINLYSSNTSSYSNSSIPFNVDPGVLADAFRQLPGLQLTKI